MVCGSPFRGSSLFVTLIILLVLIAVEYHPVGTLHVDDKSGVYYERYPLHEPKSDNERKIPSNRSESVLRRDSDENFSVNCTEPTIQDFPPDMFTQEQRQQGILFALEEKSLLRKSSILYPRLRRRCRPFHPLYLHHVDDWSRHRRVFRPIPGDHRRRYRSPSSTKMLYAASSKTLVLFEQSCT